jgi:hypothetical protein
MFEISAAQTLRYLEVMSIAVGVEPNRGFIRGYSRLGSDRDKRFANLFGSVRGSEDSGSVRLFSRFKQLKMNRS